MDWKTRLVTSSSMLLASIVIGVFSSRYLAAEPTMASSPSSLLTAPYPVSIKGEQLASRASAQLNVDLDRETRSRAASFNRRMVLNSVVFNRFQGVVIASGSLADGMGPRAVSIILDAYGSDGSYLSSSKAQGMSSPSSLAFQVQMTDNDLFDRFVVRVLDAAGSEIKLGTAVNLKEELTTLSMQTPLIPSDFRVLADLLRSLHYITGQGYPEPVAMVSLVRRFRGDHGLDIPDPRITLGDLYMVMIAAGKSPEFALGRYYQSKVDRARRDAPEIAPSAVLVERESKVSSASVSEAAPVDDESEAVILSDEVPNAQ